MIKSMNKEINVSQTKLIVKTSWESFSAETDIDLPPLTKEEMRSVLYELTGIRWDVVRYHSKTEKITLRTFIDVGADGYDHARDILRLAIEGLKDI